MTRLWIVLVVACSSSKPPPVVQKPPADATVAIVSDADPPEPKAPEIECAFSRSDFCIELHPNDPCPPTQPARQVSVVKGDALFSAQRTRAMRMTDARACCYVEFSTMACD